MLVACFSDNIDLGSSLFQFYLFNLANKPQKKWAFASLFYMFCSVLFLLNGIPVIINLARLPRQEGRGRILGIFKIPFLFLL